jgi:hypothetical protein
MCFRSHRGVLQYPSASLDSLERATHPDQRKFHIWPDGSCLLVLDVLRTTLEAMVPSELGSTVVWDVSPRYSYSYFARFILVLINPPAALWVPSESRYWMSSTRIVALLHGGSLRQPHLQTGEAAKIAFLLCSRFWLSVASLLPRWPWPRNMQLCHKYLTPEPFPSCACVIDHATVILDPAVAAKWCGHGGNLPIRSLGYLLPFSRDLDGIRCNWMQFQQVLALGVL